MSLLERHPRPGNLPSLQLLGLQRVRWAEGVRNRCRFFDSITKPVGQSDYASTAPYAANAASDANTVATVATAAVAATAVAATAVAAAAASAAAAVAAATAAAAIY